MEYATLACSILACVISIIILIIVLKNKKTGDVSLGDSQLKKIRDSVNESVGNMTGPISELVAEKNKSLMENVSKKVDDLNKKIDELIKSQNDLNQNQVKFKEETINLLNDNKDKTIKVLNEFIRQFNQDNNKQKEEIMNKLSSEIKEFNETVNKSLAEIRDDNNKKLEKINESVNEKLQKTLEEKLKDSFKSVVEGIGDVNKAVGEIKGLATDVGSLKNVLTNVKTKGILGEVILGNIIKEFLTAGQYEENVVTKAGSSERVEFAIKLPGKKDENIYLPVDSKFPYESYSIIHESSNMDEINEAKKTLRSNLLKYAKDVSEKYIDVPNTTDFAVIFLPLEGLYLEALNMGLFEEIQSKYRVNLTGPTTFTAFINSLNMGFKSLMIQKKSADVFSLLGAVKTEFGKFADALEKTQKKVNAAADELDSLVGTRTKMMNSKLKSIDALDDATTKLILEDNKQE